MVVLAEAVSAWMKGALTFLIALARKPHAAFAVTERK